MSKSLSLVPLFLSRVGNFYVLRDDLIKGGTKRRAIGVFMNDAEELVYASPAQGYAQVALAYGARDHKKRVTIFVAERKQLHPLTQEAQNVGAKIIQVPMGFLSNITAKAKQYCASRLYAKLLPFGLRDERFINALSVVMQSVKVRPSELWCVASSGTIAMAMMKAWPNVPMNCVRVGHKPELKRIKLYAAPEKYENPAKYPPPFPSCINYDAKAWQFIIEHAKKDALFWNVGA